MTAMTKSELVASLVKLNPTLHPLDVERMVNAVFEEITQSLVAEKRVELRGFGTFSVRVRAPRTGRNPRTGTAVQVPGKKVPFFKTGKEIKVKLNNS